MTADELTRAVEQYLREHDPNRQPPIPLDWLRMTHLGGLTG